MEIHGLKNLPAFQDRNNQKIMPPTRLAVEHRGKHRPTRPQLPLDRSQSRTVSLPHTEFKSGTREQGATEIVPQSSSWLSASRLTGEKSKCVAGKYRSTPLECVQYCNWSATIFIPLLHIARHHMHHEVSIESNDRAMRSQECTKCSLISCCNRAIELL